MAFMTDALLGIIVSLSFGIGAFLYLKTKEELDPIINKFKGNRFAFLKESALAPVGLVGLGLGLATISSWIAVLALLTFIGGLLFGSLLLYHEDAKVTKKYALETMGSFLIFYFVIVVLLNLA